VPTTTFAFGNVTERRDARVSQAHTPRTAAMARVGRVMAGFAMGMQKGASRLRVRGMRDDAFLDALPLTTFSRLGLQLADMVGFVPPTLAVPLGALSARGGLTLASVTAVVLAVVTRRNAVAFAPLRFLPTRGWYLPFGACCGVASGVLALAFLRHSPEHVRAAPPAVMSAEWLALFLGMIVVAPLVEEYFFRGWLQRAIHADLPPDRKRWAFAITAMVFALAHFGSFGAPQFVLGLAAGGLFAISRGLWPGIIAHACHNAVVLLFAPRMFPLP
jgi:membrane protease YdiL (CAAX protease family)